MKEKQTFSDLRVDARIVEALNEQEITEPTEIQAGAIPRAFEGKDVIGRSKTGSGKTLAFGIPIIQELLDKNGKGVRAIILSPTRELAKQIEDELILIAKKSTVQTALIYGGVAYEPQFEAVKTADIIIGTPGRIIDHIERGTIQLEEIEFFVLDEADRMLDMGFIQDIKKILEKTPVHKQNFFFSATMPMEARELAESFMHEPVRVNATDIYVNNAQLEEYYIDTLKLTKADTLRYLIEKEKPKLAIVFTNTRLFADAVTKYLQKHNIRAEALHGGFAQNKREKIIESFAAKDIHILIATDVAARGLDIEGVTHVFNFEVPGDEQDYTHRIGRTARAGNKGVAITLLEPEEHRDFSRIEGDSLRNIKKYPDNYFAKKEYLLERRNNTHPRNNKRPQRRRNT